jgi:hypothetical protein
MKELLTDLSALQAPEAIGALPWSRSDMSDALDEFAALYARRPILDNMGGMTSAHLFNFWFVLKSLKPSTVIESGVFQGQGTWLIENTVPEANIFCIDIDWSNLKYKSEHAQYVSSDFSKQNWNQIDKEKTLCFFDDHMNAFERLLLCREFGFKHIIFEDNYYPARQGDLYTLKQALAGVGYVPTRNLRYWASRVKGTRHDVPVKANLADARRIREVAEIYQELPPIFIPKVSRWNTSYSDLPTTQPLLTNISKPCYEVFAEEAEWYTWIAYVQLN